MYILRLPETRQQDADHQLHGLRRGRPVAIIISGYYY